MPVSVAAATARRKSWGVVAGVVAGHGGGSDQRLMTTSAKPARPPIRKACRPRKDAAAIVTGAIRSRQNGFITPPMRKRMVDICAMSKASCRVSVHSPRWRRSGDAAASTRLSVAASAITTSAAASC